MAGNENESGRNTRGERMRCGSPGGAHGVDEWVKLTHDVSLSTFEMTGAQRFDGRSL